MRLIWTSVSVLGVGVGALGALWFLQGSDLVHIDPILCVGDCEPVVGHHPRWQIAGAAAVAGGALITTLAVRRRRASPASGSLGSAG